MTSMVSKEMLADPRDRKFYSDIYRLEIFAQCTLTLTYPSAKDMLADPRDKIFYSGIYR
jgi:hypothetical protein